MATNERETISIEPIDLHDEDHFSELQRQRVLCGWNHSTSALEAWREANDAHTQAMFWIVPASFSALPVPQRYAGHVAMYKATYDNQDGIDDALPELTAMNLSTLFILPEFRGKGLASAAVRAMEATAKIEPYGWPECKLMTLNTLARKYIEEDEWRAVAEISFLLDGMELPPKGTSNEDWYVRMGYVKWKEVSGMYPGKSQDGSEFRFAASFLWKKLGCQ
jgi:GNAT superfamily N-acetyltransferase